MNKVILSAIVLFSLCTARAEAMNFDEARGIAIQNAGRKKPLDTFASESLQTMSGRRTFKDPQSGQRLAAVEVVISMWTGARDWKAVPIILVSDPALRQELSLSRTETLYSFQELLATQRLGEFQNRIVARQDKGEDLTPLESEAGTVIMRLDLLNRIVMGQALTIVPDPNAATGNWMTIAGAGRLYDQDTAIGLQLAFDRFSTAYAGGNAADFTAATRELRHELSALAPEFHPGVAALKREIHYNQFHPFRWAWVLYLASFFLILPKRTYRLGMWVFGAGLALNIYGFGLRTWIAERAPVTNMYESVVWVALGIAAFAFIFELIYKARVYALAAAPLAVLGLILADMLPSVLNPNIGPLPPVLRDNFWLVTHVVTICLGYSAFALAMGLAHIVLGMYLFKPKSVDDRSFIHHLLYRSLQIGVLMLAAGTILGGVWANYSWGRFWGWDPKETWALIALLLYIFAIHGKIAGWWGNFGMAVAAAVSFNGILMAWYGVNFVLGKGLHSYGFGGGGGGWVALIVGIDVLFVAGCAVAHLRRKTARAPASEFQLQPAGAEAALR